MGKIAVVDDESMLNEIMADELRIQNHHVIQVDGGDEAFQLISKEPVDLVIADIRMSKGNGIALLIKLKEQSSESPAVVLCTGMLTLGRDEAYHHGAEGILLKPFDLKALTSLVNRFTLSPNLRFQAPLTERAENIPLFPNTFSEIREAIGSKQVSVGRGGAFIPSGEDLMQSLREDQYLRIQFGEEFVVGKVRWTRRAPSSMGPAGFGFEFLNTTEAFSTYFLNLLKEKNMRAYIPKHL